jgi:hypothetical protein
MDYLQTTGDRLHDLELDRIIARLRTLEAATGTTVATPAPVQSASIVSSGVRSLTPGSGTAMFNDIALTAVGSIALSQATQTITLTVPVLVAGTGITLTPAGNNITVAASGAAATLPASAIGIYIPPTSWIMPAALTEFNGSKNYRAKSDLTNATSARLLAVQVSALPVGPLPVLAAQYSTNGGSTWAYLDGGTGPSISTFSGASITDSGFVTLAAGAKADVQLRIVGSGGDGATTVPFGNVYLEFK